MMSMGGGGGKGVPGTTTIRAKVTASAGSAAAAPRRKTGVGRAAVNGGNGTGKSFVNNSLAPMMTTAQRVVSGSFFLVHFIHSFLPLLLSHPVGGIVWFRSSPFSVWLVVWGIVVLTLCLWSEFLS